MASSALFLQTFVYPSDSASPESASSDGRRSQTGSQVYYRGLKVKAEDREADGSKEKPALNCKELKLCHPDLEDGITGSLEYVGLFYLTLCPTFDVRVLLDRSEWWM